MIDANRPLINDDHRFPHAPVGPSKKILPRLKSLTCIPRLMKMKVNFVRVIRQMHEFQQQSTSIGDNSKKTKKSGLINR